MYPVLWQIGNFELRSYGVIVAASYLLGVWLSMKEARGNGLESQIVHDFAVYALIGGLIGARLSFVLFSQPTYFRQNPWEIPTIWRGGMNIIGSLIDDFAIAVWFCRARKISFLQLG